MRSKYFGFLLIHWAVLAQDDLVDYDLAVAPLTANNTDNAQFMCHASSANFGNVIRTDLIGCLIPANPLDACIQPKFPHFANESYLWDICSPVALVIRGNNCSFAQKVFNVQQAGYFAAVVFNNVEGPDIHMSGDVSSGEIQIPSYFISKSCGEALLANYTLNKKYEVIIAKDTDSDNLFRYLIPFVAVVGLCFLITLVALIIKLARDKRKELRKRLSRRKLKKLPTKKYKKNDTPETCPICLDDFIDGEKLRVLPCNHWYHLKCVDPWLTKNRKVCPVCKRKVMASDSDSDSEGPHEERPSSSSSERRPLLTPNSPETYGSIASYPDRTGDDENDVGGPVTLSPASSSEPSSPVLNRNAPIVLGFTSIRNNRSGDPDPNTSNRSATLDGIQNAAYEPAVNEEEQTGIVQPYSDSVNPDSDSTSSGYVNSDELVEAVLPATNEYNADDVINHIV